VGVIGPKEVVTGDTLCDAGHPILLETIAFPETVISMAVEPETNADRKKLEDALGRLARQDPTFNAKVSGETGQTIISGMGELHLEVLRERLQRDYNLNVRVHKPRVSYRETVRNKVRATGEFNRTVQGETQFASVTIEFEPFQGEESIAVRSQLKPDDLPADMLKVLMQAVLETGQGGGKVGYPLMHVRFTIVDVDYREAQSTEEALRQAAQRAVQNAVNDADIALLEPVMRLEVVTPPEFVGNIQADLNIRHARIFGSEQRGHLTVLDAEAPLANMFGYSTNVRSLSQGRASYSMEPLKYDLAPDSVLREMLS
jgi:elongation factor G